MGKKICANCEQIIGNLEEYFFHKSQVVCKACKILLENKSQTIGIIESKTESEIPEPPACAIEQTAPLFLYIPVSRLIVMSIVSFGIYEFYWIYKNWRYVKERDNLDISPFWRGWFGIFYCHSLLRRIHEDKESCAVQTPSFSPGGLATGWVVLSFISYVVGRAPGIAASIIAAFIPSFLFPCSRSELRQLCERTAESWPALLPLVIGTCCMSCLRNNHLVTLLVRD